MNSSERSEPGNFGAFMTGALVGAGIALLFAPEAGSQVRNRLRDFATRYAKELDETVDRGAQMLDDSIDRGHELLEKGKESLQQVGRQAKGLAEAGSKAVNEATGEITSPNR